MGLEEVLHVILVVVLPGQFEHFSVPGAGEITPNHIVEPRRDAPTRLRFIQLGDRLGAVAKLTNELQRRLIKHGRRREVQEKRTVAQLLIFNVSVSLVPPDDAQESLAVRDVSSQVFADGVVVRLTGKRPESVGKLALNRLRLGFEFVEAADEMHNRLFVGGQEGFDVALRHVLQVKAVTTERIVQ